MLSVVNIGQIDKKNVVFNQALKKILLVYAIDSPFFKDKIESEFIYKEEAHCPHRSPEQQ